MSVHVIGRASRASARTGRPARWSRVLASVAIPLGLTSVALAQPPANIEAGIQKIGRIVDPACTADLYRPLMPKDDISSNVTPLYPGISIARNVAFGSDPDDVADIFWSDKGGDSRPVLIYLSGGMGDKTMITNKASNAFFDNIARWATKHGMVGVLMQRHSQEAWDGETREFAGLMQWLQDNIAHYHGDPTRMFAWGHSAGNIPLAVYIAHSEYHGPKGVGLVGAIMMSGAFNAAPMPALKITKEQTAAFANIGVACGERGGVESTTGALPGIAPGTPGGPPLPGAMVRFRKSIAPADDAATQLARSSLPGLKSTPVHLLLVVAEYDPPNLPVFSRNLKKELCEAGPSHCPTLVFAKAESHMSEALSIDTPDHAVSGPVLAFIHKTLAASPSE